MKRGAGLAIIATAVLAGSAAARPAGVLHGDVEPSGSVKVELSLSERGGVKLRGYRVSFRDVPMQCSRGSAQTFDLRASKLLYRRKTRRFAATAVTLGTGGETQGYWAYEGRLVRKNFARGTIKVRDRAFAVGQGQTDDCRSGELRWSASRAQADG